MSEFAWLVEHARAPQYWIGVSPHTMTYDANKAMRFARKIDAQNAIDWMVSPFLAEDCKPVEHGWTE